ncbi:TonB family protein [Psychrobacter sp. AH5]|uniref:TonB family protein n=1 Tax=Psychrobacter sp. AH5 TaxID=2937433 RepID=UPI00333EEC4B
MGSENLNAPPYRVILIIISVVVSLHILTAVAIVMVQPPAISEEEKQIEPIEIQLLTLPAETPKPMVEKAVAKPVPKSVQPPQKASEPLKAKSKPKLADTVKPKAVVEPKPASEVVSKPVKPKVDKAEADKPVEVKKVVELQPTPKVETITSTKLAEQQAEQQRQKVLAAQAHAKAMQQAQQRQAELEAQRAAQAEREAQAAATAKAAREAAEKAAQLAKEQAAKAAAEKAKAASSEPVSYGAIGNSSWLREPIFTSIKNKDYGFKGTEVSITVSMSVDANGTIGNIKISKSSGNHKFDRDFIRALSNAKLNPATRDNTPVKSTAILPFRMTL